MELLARVARLARRIRNGRRYGVSFLLARRFAVPSELQVGARRVPMHLPSEAGVRADFISIFLDDVYCLRKVNPRPVTVLDIGANVGLFLLAARANFPAATIHGYEANGSLKPFLDGQAAAAGAVIYYEAVGGCDGFISLVCRGDSNQTRVEQDSDGSVPQVALRTAVARLGGSVDLAKIDCEGSEWSMFADRSPWQAIRNLVIEYHLWASPGRSHSDAAAVIEDLGYRIVGHITDQDFGLLTATRCE